MVNLFFYIVIFGLMMGVFIVDYYLVCKCKLKFGDFYYLNFIGIYYFFKGVNLRFYVFWILGFVFLIGGMVFLDLKNNILIGFIRIFYIGFIMGYVIFFLS